MGRVFFEPQALQAHAFSFDTSVFETRMRCLIEDALEEHRSNNSILGIKRKSLIDEETLERPFVPTTLAEEFVGKYRNPRK